MICYNIMIADNITELYKHYKKNGGFGMFMLDDLLGKNIKADDIPQIVALECKIIELYHITYEIPITLDILETKYLGRKRVSVYNRINYRLHNSIRNGVKNSKNHIDIYTHFMKNISIKGYMSREYWKENEEMKNELIM